MVKINDNCLAMVSVLGEISAPVMGAPYRVGYDGVPRVGPATGGITYNVSIGDIVYGWAGDHIEPGVSTKNEDVKKNAAYNVLSCIGNQAKVVSGEGKGTEGIVIGKHGGIEHVMVHFPAETMDNLAIGDKIQVKSYGQGMAFLEYPGIKVMNLSPRMLEVWGIKETGGKLQVPVAAVVPGHLMGSGLGAPSAERGDYDITTQDKEELKKHGLENLRFGDLVAITDHASYFGRHYRQGAVTIGVVIHSDSFISGHGPGVTTLLTTLDGNIEWVMEPKANIGHYLGLKTL